MIDNSRPATGASDQGAFDLESADRHVFFNGEKAEKAFRRHTLPSLTDQQLQFQRLPSTSPAHASMTLKEKVKAWSVVPVALSE
jgi:TDG/mug DNA glycosylase family protein